MSTGGNRDIGGDKKQCIDEATVAAPAANPQAAAFLVQLVRGLTISPVGGGPQARLNRRPRARPMRRDGWQDRLTPEPIRPS